MPAELPVAMPTALVIYIFLFGDDGGYNRNVEAVGIGHDFFSQKIWAGTLARTYERGIINGSLGGGGVAINKQGYVEKLLKKKCVVVVVVVSFPEN